MRSFFLLITLLVALSAVSPAAAVAGLNRSLSTWIGVGTRTGTAGQMGGRDITEALEWVTAHKDHISSLSVTGYGKGGAKNLTSTEFNQALSSMGIDTYVLIGGNYVNFKTPEAIQDTVKTYLDMVEKGAYSGVDLDYEHPQTWGPQFVNMNASFAAELKAKYSDFLRAMSSAMHAKGYKISSCVGTYPTRSNGVDVFYDTAVMAETNDLVRVMNYDMYYVGGRSGDFPGRPDCYGMGPTSTQPWAAMSMTWWSKRVPKSKLVMGLPAYSNDYSSKPGFGGGNGTQASIGPPWEQGNAPKNGQLEAVWDFFQQIYLYLYDAGDGNGPRIRYGTEAESTKAHLRTAIAKEISAVGFWTADMTDTPMEDAVWEWAQGGDASPAAGLK